MVLLRFNTFQYLSFFAPLTAILPLFQINSAEFHARMQSKKKTRTADSLLSALQGDALIGSSIKKSGELFMGFLIFLYLFIYYIFFYFFF